MCICLESIAVHGSAACSALVHCCFAVPCCMFVAVGTCRPPGLCAGYALAALQDAFARGWVHTNTKSRMACGHELELRGVCKEAGHVNLAGTAALFCSAYNLLHTQRIR